jgi:hypothetical protein
MYSESLMGYLSEAENSLETAVDNLRLAHKGLCDTNPLAATLMEPLLTQAVELMQRVGSAYMSTCGDAGDDR